jgi:hypothetical protein
MQRAALLAAMKLAIGYPDPIRVGSHALPTLRPRWE